MADRPADDFPNRWSRRKRAARAGTIEPERPEPCAPGDPKPAPPAAVANPAAGPGVAESEGDPEVVAHLPDIDTLDDSSDFTVFLQSGVPDALRRRALRKLWRVNPVLANLDGLNNYDEDYSKLGMVDMPGLKSLFQVGRGMVSEEPPARANEADTAETLEPPAPGSESAAIPVTQDLAQTAKPSPAPSPAPPRPEDSKPAAAKAADRAAPKRGAAERRWGRTRS
jgi:hypothetical protein